ncbi:MAG: M15 family metallopeptidase [Brevundimonas sp.]
MRAYFGDPDPDHDGVANRAWEDANIAKLTPPYRMVLAWDPTKVVSTIRIHRKCIGSLDNILHGILAHYGSQAAIEKARMHLFGGAYNFRLKRGGTTLSNHSWASAIDLDPANNAFGKVWKPNTGMMPLEVVEIFKREGWRWGGKWSTGDAMHFEAVRS